MAPTEAQPPGTRRRSGLPLGATLMTLLMVPVLIAMGIWQLQRREWKAQWKEWKRLIKIVNQLHVYQ